MPYYIYIYYFFTFIAVIFLSTIRLSNSPMLRALVGDSQTRRLRAPGEQTPQGLRTRANKATKLRILLYEPLLGVNTYAL